MVTPKALCGLMLVVLFTGVVSCGSTAPPAAPPATNTPTLGAPATPVPATSAPTTAATLQAAAGPVEFVAVVNNPADLDKGVGVAAIEVEPYTTPLLKSGKAFALVDLPSEADTVRWLGGEYPGASLVAATDTIQKRPQTVQKMTNALVKALRYIGSHSAAEIAGILPDEVTGKDKALYGDVLQRSLPMFSKDVIVSGAAVNNAIVVHKAMGALKPDVQINASALYTNEFVKNVK